MQAMNDKIGPMEQDFGLASGIQLC